MADKMNSYELSRTFTDWAFENPDQIKPIHYAIYFFAIEHCNRLGWKEKFGLPSQMVMEAIGVKNWRTYSSGLKDLEDFGFILMIERSKNQYSSNIVAIVKNTKAPTKALDKALSKHSQKQGTKHSQSTVQGTVSINKQVTSNKEQGTIKQVTLLCSISDESELDTSEDLISFSFWKLFKKHKAEAGIESTVNLDKAKLSDWSNTVRLTIQQDKRTEEEFREVWSFLNTDEWWKGKVQSMSKLRKQFEQLLEKSRISHPKQNKSTDVMDELQEKLRNKYEQS